MEIFGGFIWGVIFTAIITSYILGAKKKGLQKIPDNFLNLIQDMKYDPEFGLYVILPSLNKKIENELRSSICLDIEAKPSPKKMLYTVAVRP